MQVESIRSEAVLKDRVYAALKQAIVAMDIYGTEQQPRLDERRLGEQLGVSRTPVREALMRLEHEGLVRLVPRRGAFVVRKSRREIVEIIQAWAGLEGIAARLAAGAASDAELQALRNEFVSFDSTDKASANIDEYSEQNIRFHQQIISLSQSRQVQSMMSDLFVQMQFIRRHSVRDSDRTEQSLRDHILIIEALLARDASRAHDLVVGHALSLAEHVETHVTYLD